MVLETLEEHCFIQQAMKKSKHLEIQLCFKINREICILLRETKHPLLVIIGERKQAENSNCSSVNFLP